jgi:hypothetical protein
MLDCILAPALTVIVKVTKVICSSIYHFLLFVEPNVATKFNLSRVKEKKFVFVCGIKIFLNRINASKRSLIEDSMLADPSLGYANKSCNKL